MVKPPNPIGFFFSAGAGRGIQKIKLRITNPNTLPLGIEIPNSNRTLNVIA